MKIAHKLILGLMLLVSLIWGVGLYAVAVSRRALRESIARSSEDSAAVIIAEVDRTIHAHVDDWRIYSCSLIVQHALEASNRQFEKLPDIQAHIDRQDREWVGAPKNEVTPFMKGLMSNELAEELKRRLEAMQTHHNHRVYGEVFLTNRYGANVAQTSRTSDYRQDEEEWWQQARKDGLYVKQVTYDESAGVYSIDICTRIDDDQGNFLGVIKAVLNVDSVFAILWAESSDSHHEVGDVRHPHHMILLAADRTVLFSSYDPAVGPKDGTVYRHSFDRPDAGHTYTFERHDDKQGEILASCAFSQGHDEYKGLGWILVVEHSAEDAFSRVVALRNSILVMSVVIAVGALLTGLVFSVSFSRRITRLKDTAVALGRGDLKARIEDNSGDEVGQLAQCFNEMGSKLKRSSDDLQKHAELLEQRVNERTEQLSNARTTAVNMMEDAEEARKKAEQANEALRREIEERERAEEQVAIFQRFVEASGQGFAMADLNGRITYLNATLCHILGLEKPDDALGKRFLEYYPEDFWQEIQEETVPSVMREGQWVGELTILTNKGVATPILENMFLIRDATGTPLCLATVITDITDRKQAEDALRQRTHDLGERIKELNCLHGVSKLLENPDNPVQEIMQETVALMPVSWQYPEITCARIILDGEVFESGNFEETPWKQSASILVNDKWAGVVQVCCLEERPRHDEGPFSKEERALLNTIAERLGHFIERNKAEAEVRSLKQQMEFILGATKTGLHIIDSDYLVRYVDAEWRKLYGNPTGRKCYEYFDGYSEPCGDCRLAEALKTNRVTVTEKRLSKENNRPIQETSIPFQNEQGEWLVAQVNVDISERKRLERELGQAQRLEAIGQLAAGIAHEINTPTQYISDNTRFLQDAFGDFEKLLGTFQRLLRATEEGTVTDDLIAEVDAALREADVNYLANEIPEAIRQSLEGLDRVASIVRAMKEFSHPGGKQKQAIDLNRAIESTLTISRNEWKYVADLVTDFDTNLPLVPCLPGDFNQVILNLVVNAAHAIADVVADRSKGKGTITVSTRRDGDWAEIRIEDTGAGIPEGIRSKIFDHFFTTKDVGKGTGQGLTIARSIVVEKHGGTLAFETETGRGTTFFIRLPINDQSPVTEDTQPKEMQAIS